MKQMVDSDHENRPLKNLNLDAGYRT